MLSYLRTDNKICEMENAEEVMQLLEEFSKIKPKDIPRELEDYLGYVAKTGDPVYQWSLVKNLFREKLLNVISDFYESTLTVELPPCPNVDSFNYERMKTSLLERFDTFSSAPFTVQRICELLTNPRKEYNRADKYMRAIEKNILVVSTREPGTGKRSLECDSQSETVLNGIPDLKLNESDGSLLHIPTDLPYLGAPPASNDVTVETSEPNSTIIERVGLDLNGEAKTLKLDSDKPWPTQDSALIITHDIITHDAKENNTTETLDINVSENEEKCSEEIGFDANNILTSVEEPSMKLNVDNFEDEGSSDMFIQNSESILPDTGSIDSSDSSQESNEIPSNPNRENEEETKSASDENEVSSTPANGTVAILLIQEEIDEPTDSEAEATDTSLVQDSESGVNSSPDEEINSSEEVIQSDVTKSVTISEVTATKLNEVDLECNEITGTVKSPTSPEDNSSSDINDFVEQNINLDVLEECEQADSHPDSSNDICLQNRATTSESQKTKLCAEADSMSDTNISLSELTTTNDYGVAPDQTNSEILYTDNITQASSPEIRAITEEECLDKNPEDPVFPSSSPEETLVSEGQCLNSLADNPIKLAEVESTSEVAEEMCEQERREGSVIHSVLNITPDSQQLAIVEEINVDPSCETEEEAMDVDDTSNQMMISEGENEGEPMEQCDQLQS